MSVIIFDKFFPPENMAVLRIIFIVLNNGESSHLLRGQEGRAGAKKIVLQWKMMIHTASFFRQFFYIFFL